MRKVMMIAAVMVAGAGALAQSGQFTFQKNKIWLSETGFDELKGYKNAIILNTQPRMILAKKQGEAMLCPMPSSPGAPWPHCWAAAD